MIHGTRRLERLEEDLAADVEPTVTDLTRMQASGDAVSIHGDRSREHLEHQVEK